MIDTTSPSQEGFGSNGLFFHAVHTQVAITGGGHHHLFKRIEFSTCLKILHEGETSLFQEFHVRFTVRQEFGLKIKDDLSCHLFVVPRVEIATFLDRHPVGHVEGFVGKRSYVRLMFGGVEQMRKVSFLDLGEPERLGEIAQRHLEEGERIDEPYGCLFVRVRELEDFPTVSDLFNLSLLPVEFIDDRVTVVPFEIMGDYRQGSRSMLGQRF